MQGLLSDFSGQIHGPDVAPFCYESSDRTAALFDGSRLANATSAICLHRYLSVCEKIRTGFDPSASLGLG